MSLLKSSSTNIEWTALGAGAIATPKNRRMLQVADAASGACYAAFNRDEFGGVETSYLDAMQHRLWHRSGRGRLQDGLKVWPWPDARMAADYAWLSCY